MNQAQAIGSITNTYLKYGIVPVGKKSKTLGLPTSSSAGSVKIDVLFDNAKEKQSLLYDPIAERFFGVKGWYKANCAQVGDQVAIEAVSHGQLYRFRLLPKQSHKVPAQKKTQVPATMSAKRGRGESVVGQPINYHGLVYAPANEQGVVLLFGKVFEELGMMVEEVKTGFPDATVRRFNGRGWVRERVEFEYESSSFKKHKHPVEGCDIIVCWKHNWTECPLEVIDLEKFVSVISTDKTTSTGKLL